MYDRNLLSRLATKEHQHLFSRGLTRFVDQSNAPAGEPIFDIDYDEGQ